MKNFTQTTKKGIRLSIILIASILLWSTIIFYSANIQQISILNVNPPNLSSRWSTSSSSPEYLPNGVYLLENYPWEHDDYYYETYVMTSTKYHLVSAYGREATVLLSGSYQSSAPHYLHRPSSNEQLDPEISTTLSAGLCIVEAESAMDIVFNTKYKIEDFKSSYSEHFELYQVNFVAGRTYTVLLESTSFQRFYLEVARVPSGGSWPSSNSSNSDIGFSKTDLITKSEYVTITPKYSDVYAIVVIRLNEAYVEPTLVVYEGLYLDTLLVIALIILGVVIAIAICRTLYYRYLAPEESKTKRKFKQLRGKLNDYLPGTRLQGVNEMSMFLKNHPEFKPQVVNKYWKLSADDPDPKVRKSATTVLNSLLEE